MQSYAGDIRRHFDAYQGRRAAYYAIERRVGVRAPPDLERGFSRRQAPRVGVGDDAGDGARRKSNDVRRRDRGSRLGAEAEILLDPTTVDHKISARRWNLVMRGLAVHHNSRHFRATALSAWEKHHARAVSLAPTVDRDGAREIQVGAGKSTTKFYRDGYLEASQEQKF